MNWKQYLKRAYRTVFRGTKSYSQLGEDLIAAFFLSGIENGHYVDIGANDPVYLNNTYLFYKKGWNGLCVEPNSLLCNLISSSRPRDKVLNVGIGGSKSEMDFYVINPDTLSTFSAAEAERMKGLGHKILEIKKVPIRALSNVLEDFKLPIDLLSIDTEGMDLEILRGNDWASYRPKLIIAEIAEYQGKIAERINKPYDEFMASKGYLKLADTYINGIYVEKNYANSKHLEGI